MPRPVSAQHQLHSLNCSPCTGSQAEPVVCSITGGCPWVQTGAQQGLISAVALRNFKLPAFDICEAEALRAAVEVLRNKSVSNSCLIPSLYRLPHYSTACSLQLLPASPGLMDFSCLCATSLSQSSSPGRHSAACSSPSWCEGSPSTLWRGCSRCCPKMRRAQKLPWPR